jgi:hypothetical protein
MFDAMIAGERHRLWRGYARALAAGTVRRVMGESMYARAAEQVR